jgi:hypothetical protein
MSESKSLTKEKMFAALEALDNLLEEPLKLIIGGGGAMVMVHGYPLTTMDIDAIPINRDISEIDGLVKRVANDLNLPPDWLNAWFSSFAYTIPKDYEDRLIPTFKGKQIEALSLSTTDLLVLKCFAGRQKDIGHARMLIKKGADVEFVQEHLEEMVERKVPRAESAIDFLDELEV